MLGPPPPGMNTVKVVSGGTERKPGLSWFFDRLSAPAWKWQLAHAWPSLPTAISQNSALPRAIAAVLSLMYAARLRGTGTAMVFRDASPATTCGGGHSAFALTDPKGLLKPIAPPVKPPTARRSGE